MKERLRFIADQEGCVFKGADMDSDQVEKERELVFDAILDLSHGDMRRAVTALQSAHTLTGMGAFGPIEVRLFLFNSYFSGMMTQDREIRFSFFFVFHVFVCLIAQEH